jgi:L-seryl-tRNA(Ser) seleniumtransferase
LEGIRLKHLLRYIPPIHELQKDQRFLQIMNNKSIDLIHITNLLKAVISGIRNDMLEGVWGGPEPGSSAFHDVIFQKLEETAGKEFSHTIKRVINATGTILHTNLGRARLSKDAAQHMLDTAVHYSNLEYQIEEGKRGSRHSHVEGVIKTLTGAEAAMVVNNNAAAVYLILKALAANQEVIVSRGQLVEIGGSFRISSIMEESGAHLVEIGTTNKTHLKDYEEAITAQTAMVLKVHTSNYKVIGFTKTVETEELATLAKHSGVIFYEDLGSGALYNFTKHGIGDEPVVKEVLNKGADLVSFSGDKLLGGPQAGIIAGKKELIDRLKTHQLARVLRVDKMTLAALEGTLNEYVKGDRGVRNIPIIHELLLSQEEMKERTEGFIAKLKSAADQYEVSFTESIGQVGGGTMPDVELPSYAAVIKHQTMTAQELAEKLRKESSPSIIVRIQKDEVLIDLRSVSEEEEEIIVGALQSF